MPGELKDGVATKNYQPRATRCYCEGMAKRLESTTIGDNPYEGENATAYGSGFAYVSNQPLFTINRNNDQGCALTGTGPTPV